MNKKKLIDEIIKILLKYQYNLSTLKIQVFNRSILIIKQRYTCTKKQYQIKNNNNIFKLNIKK